MARAKRKQVHEAEPNVGDAADGPAPPAQPVVESAADAMLMPAEQQPPRSWVQRTECIGDFKAGVHFEFDHETHKGRIRFDKTPSQAVRDHLKQNYYCENPETHHWEIPIRYESREEDREHAKKIAHEVAKMIRKESGIEPAHEPNPG